MDNKNQSWAVEEAVGGMNEDNRIYEAEKNGWGGGGCYRSQLKIIGRIDEWMNNSCYMFGQNEWRE